ncbi:MAG: hypothetical protein AAF985_14635 [Bacteroidota bacterium]
MKSKQHYLSGKSVFWISLIVIFLTVLSVYLTGLHDNRSITTNFYFSLGMISGSLFLFLTYGLYAGFRLKDDYESDEAKHNKESGDGGFELPDWPLFDFGEFGEGWLFSLLWWVFATLAILVFLFLASYVFTYSILIILSMLYWLFFRALRIVFRQSVRTKGDLLAALTNALVYTFLYTGWMFGLVYLSQLL